MITDNSKLMICEDCCRQHGRLWRPWIQGDGDGKLTHNCSNCGKSMIETNLVQKEVRIISKISTDWNFYQAMMDLKDKDIIEFNLKLSQFENQINQKQATKNQSNCTQKNQQEHNIPKCPVCGSTNISPISTGERAMSVIGFGILSKKINKSFKCLDCKYTW
jgi:hypothetical protein